MNIYQTILFVTLAGTVGSAPLSQKLDIMDKDTVEQAHSFISKILADIPTTHAAWINYKSLTLDQPSSDLQFLKNSTIPAAPQLKSISDNFTLEMCLARIVDGLNLHLNLLKVISKAPTMNQTKEVPELQAEIQDLLYLIFELQDQAGYEQAMDNQLQTLKHSLAEPLKDEFMTKMMAHLTLQQLQVFSCDVLRSILSIRSSTSSMPVSETPNTVQQCGTAAGR
ncbi:colony stimulating factor 3 (granulocyte) a [Xyrauchen texanus]|uniref:colony stimulating factor 3 (granulocyte) a n=1 Tax=Xyrauchen texanus TaxID=154827 RepID=UPI002241DA2A|nr:colony stimulating factor 3 (granulocyte) a [Xyrauchen texanus]